MTIDLRNSTNPHSDKTGNVFKPIVIPVDFRKIPTAANDKLIIWRSPPKIFIQHVGYHCVRAEGHFAECLCGNSADDEFWFERGANPGKIELQLAGRQRQQPGIATYFTNGEEVNITPEQDVDEALVEIFIWAWDFRFEPTEIL